MHQYAKGFLLECGDRLLKIMDAKVHIDLFDNLRRKDLRQQDSYSLPQFHVAPEQSLRLLLI